jgi:hypothetical protein
MQTLSAQPPCDAIIPMEWPPSLPVPTGAGAGREFKVFFYPLGRPGAPDFVLAPRGESVFNSETGHVSSCRRLEGQPQGLSDKRWPAGIGKLTIDEFILKQDRLYAASQEVAGLYAAKGVTTNETRAILRTYGGQFLEMAEPALRSYYYRLNPDFWQWLKDAGAPTLEKPR